MKKGVVIGIAVIVVAFAVFLIGDSKGWFYTFENYTEDHHLRDELNKDDLSSLMNTESYFPEDSDAVKEHRAQVDKIFGETWHSDNYKKEEIVFPEVQAEETVDGEYWFPPINNSAPLDEIAPTISYELMLDGYKISPYYPQNPEKYTAQALNDNAFPINFFRKVNDLCYYTVCKVEGGGYIYYFFCANGNVDYEKAMEAAGKELNYDANGNLLVEETVHLFNAELADIASMDLTKEVVWRGSVYAAEELGSSTEFDNTIDAIYKNTNWYKKSPYSIGKDISLSFNPVLLLQDKWAENSCGVPDSSRDLYYGTLQRINANGGLLETYHMCSDGYVKVQYLIDQYASPETVEGVKGANTLQVSGHGIVSDEDIVFHYFGTGEKKEQSREYNSYSIKILPQDNIHNLK